MAEGLGLGGTFDQTFEKTVNNNRSKMTHSMPMIFQTANLTYEDRFSVYWNVILETCKPDEVAARSAKYVAQNVCQCGWTAVWRSSPKSSGCEKPFDVVVEVKLLLF